MVDGKHYNYQQDMFLLKRVDYMLSINQTILYIYLY